MTPAATTSVQQLLGHDASAHRSMCKTGMPKTSARTGLPHISSVFNDPQTSKAAAMMRQEIGKQCQAETSPHFWRVGSPRRSKQPHLRRTGRAGGYPSAQVYPSYTVRGGYSKDSMESTDAGAERKHGAQDLLFPSPATFMNPHVAVGMSRSNSKSASAPCLGAGQDVRELDTKPAAKAPQSLLSLVSCERRASVIKRRMSFTRPLLADVMANMTQR